MRRSLIAGNWKMHGNLDSAKALLQAVKTGAAELRDVDLAVFPPFVYLAEAQRALDDSPVAWGAQNLSEHEQGAYTGEVAASMLLDFGCRYALVGHSERRALYGENDAVIARKFAAARDAGLIPMLCVGETLEEREAGVTEAVVERQLRAVLDLDGPGGFGEGVIAYEPVWAIGTGRTATPEQAQEVHAFIRSLLGDEDATLGNSVGILYGGSVKAANARELLAKADIDGALVGGASLKAEEFLTIARAAP